VGEGAVEFRHHHEGAQILQPRWKPSDQRLDLCSNGRARQGRFFVSAHVSASLGDSPSLSFRVASQPTASQPAASWPEAPTRHSIGQATSEPAGALQRPRAPCVQAKAACGVWPAAGRRKRCCRVAASAPVRFVCSAGRRLAASSARLALRLAWPGWAGGITGCRPAASRPGSLRPTSFSSAAQQLSSKSLIFPARFLPLNYSAERWFAHSPDQCLDSSLASCSKLRGEPKRRREREREESAKKRQQQHNNGTKRACPPRPPREAARKAE